MPRRWRYGSTPMTRPHLLAVGPASPPPAATESPWRPRIPPLVIPETSHGFVVRRLVDGESWVIGRAGMRYRDLLPERLGGAIIASHIRIADAGPVADMVHYHTGRLPTHLLPPRVGAARLRGPGAAVRALRRRLRDPAPGDPPPGARSLGRGRGDRNRGPRRAPHEH